MFRLLKQLFCKHSHVVSRVETYEDLVGPPYSVEYQKCKTCGKQWELDVPYVSVNSVGYSTKINLTPLPKRIRREDLLVKKIKAKGISIKSKDE